MSPRARRELSAAVVLCLVGAFLVLVAAVRPWAQVQLSATGLVAARTVDVTGSELAPGLTALGLVGLAGVVALAATRRWGRIVVGSLLLLVAVGVLWLVVDRLGRLDQAARDSATIRDSAAGVQGVSASVWPIVTLGGAVLLAVAGLLVAARGPGWAGLGRRFAAPAAAAGAPAPTPVQAASLSASDRGTPPSTSDRAAPPSTSGRAAPAEGDVHAASTTEPGQDLAAQRTLWESLDRGEDPTAR